MIDYKKTRILNIIYVVLKHADDMNHKIRLYDLMYILYYTQLSHLEKYGHIIEEIANHNAMVAGPITSHIYANFRTKEYENCFPIGKNHQFIYISNKEYRDITYSNLDYFIPNLDYLSRSEMHCLKLETDWHIKTPLGVRRKRLDDDKAYTKARAKAKLNKREAYPMEWLDIVRSAGVPRCSIDWVLENIENMYIDLSEWELF